MRERSKCKMILERGQKVCAQEEKEKNEGKHHIDENMEDSG